jgi:ZIP family zinc transporter
MGDVTVAFGLTLFAGMATAIGSIIAFAAKRTNYRFLSITTGFSAGVMLYISFVEIFFKGTEVLTECYGESTASWINAASFFAGMLLIGLIDNLIPTASNPHEIHSETETRPLREHTSPESARGDRSVRGPAGPGSSHKLLRAGIFTALAIGLHNFPEGLATFLAALRDPGTGIAVAVAIALHNIPEGISVSVPIYYATGSRRKAFVYSALSGLTEPIGALVAYGAIRCFLGANCGVIPPEIMGILFGVVAGIMVYISLDVLLPVSRIYGRGHDSLLGLVAGMLVMALSLLIVN